MGYKTIQIKVPTDYSEEYLKAAVKKQLGINNFSLQIEKKSLDARKKNDIHWLLGIAVSSKELKGEEKELEEPFDIPNKKRKERIVVVGSGPAGFFAAHVLQLAGFIVTIIERGADVMERSGKIDILESRGIFDEKSNYAFGEGGAGTFSDGKLTSRSKHISNERNFILSEYVKAGAPEEIRYMTHPHVGTDNLKVVVANLRKSFLDNGGTFLFETKLLDIDIKDGKSLGVFTDSGDFEADHVILATGHSAYDTYRMLLRKGLPFRTKNFALGHRIEHPQHLINKAQWNNISLPGVKAAEYRLSTKAKNGLGVYTFCMCPGGKIVPAGAYKEKGVVNGMSYYARNGKFANAGCVAGVHPDMLVGHTSTPREILDWMDGLESNFYDFTKSYKMPAVNASDYIGKRKSKYLPKTSYPLGVESAPLFNMIPKVVSEALVDGLKDFSNKIHGFDKGLLLGLESKTSSPIQILRDREGKVENYENIYFIGEGSGYAGGIISSAADGVKCAMSLIR